MHDGRDHDRYNNLSESLKTKAKVGGHYIGPPICDFLLLQKEK